MNRNDLRQQIHDALADDETFVFIYPDGAIGASHLSSDMVELLTALAPDDERLAARRQRLRASNLR